MSQISGGEKNKKCFFKTDMQKCEHYGGKKKRNYRRVNIESGFDDAELEVMNVVNCCHSNSSPHFYFCFCFSFIGKFGLVKITN